MTSLWSDPEVVIIAVLLLATVAAGIQASRLPHGEPKALWTFIGSCLFGVLFCFAGVWNLIGIHTARRLTASGTITGLDKASGQSASDFVVVPASGQPLKVHCDYTGPRLENGENVVVEELSFHSTLLHLQVLGGINSGWKLDERDGTASSIVVIVLGTALVLGARARRLNHPEG